MAEQLDSGLRAALADPLTLALAALEAASIALRDLADLGEAAVQLLPGSFEEPLVLVVLKVQRQMAVAADEKVEASLRAVRAVGGSNA